MIDPHAALAPYIQLATLLVDKIRTGEIPPGTRLPSVVQLAEHYRIAKNTAHKGVRLLVQQGYAEVSPGRGVFVKKDSALPPLV